MNPIEKLSGNGTPPEPIKPVKRGPDIPNVPVLGEQPTPPPVQQTSPSPEPQTSPPPEQQMSPINLPSDLSPDALVDPVQPTPTAPQPLQSLQPPQPQEQPFNSVDYLGQSGTSLPNQRLGQLPSENLYNAVAPNVVNSITDDARFLQRSTAAVQGATQQSIYPALYEAPNLQEAAAGLNNDWSITLADLQRRETQRQLQVQTSTSTEEWARNALQQVRAIPQGSTNPLDGLMGWASSTFTRDGNRGYINVLTQNADGSYGSNVGGALLYGLSLPWNATVGAAIDGRNLLSNAFNNFTPPWLRNSGVSTGVQKALQFTGLGVLGTWVTGKNRLNDGKSNLVEALRGAQFSFGDDAGTGIGIKVDTGSFRYKDPVLTAINKVTGGTLKPIEFDVNPSALLGFGLDVFVGAKVDKAINAIGRRVGFGAKSVEGVIRPAATQAAQAVKAPPPVYIQPSLPFLPSVPTVYKPLTEAQMEAQRAAKVASLKFDKRQMELAKQLNTQRRRAERLYAKDEQMVLNLPGFRPVYQAQREVQRAAFDKQVRAAQRAGEFKGYKVQLREGENARQLSLDKQLGVPRNKPPKQGAEVATPPKAVDAVQGEIPLYGTSMLPKEQRLLTDVRTVTSVDVAPPRSLPPSSVRQLEGVIDVRALHPEEELRGVKHALLKGTDGSESVAAVVPRKGAPSLPPSSVRPLAVHRRLVESIASQLEIPPSIAKTIVNIDKAEGVVDLTKLLKKVDDALPSIQTTEEAAQKVADVVNESLKGKVIHAIAAKADSTLEKTIADTVTTSDVGRKFVTDWPQRPFAQGAVPQVDLPTKPPAKKLYHGTRVQNHDLITADPLQGGGRNELGVGHYLTSKKSSAVDAARADVAPNLPPVEGREFGDPSLLAVTVDEGANLVDARVKSGGMAQIAKHVAKSFPEIKVAWTGKMSLTEVLDYSAKHLDEGLDREFQRHLSIALQQAGYDGIKAGNLQTLFDGARITSQKSYAVTDKALTPLASKAARTRLDREAVKQVPSSEIAKANAADAVAGEAVQINHELKDAVVQQEHAILRATENAGMWEHPTIDNAFQWVDDMPVYVGEIEDLFPSNNVPEVLTEVVTPRATDLVEVVPKTAKVKPEVVPPTVAKKAEMIQTVVQDAFKGTKDTTHYVRPGEFTWPKEPIYFDDLSPDANTLLQVAQHNGEDAILYHEVGKKLGWEPERVHKASHELQRKDIGVGSTLQEQDFYADHGFPDFFEYNWRPDVHEDLFFIMSEHTLSFENSTRIRDLVSKAKAAPALEVKSPAVPKAVSTAKPAPKAEMVQNIVRDAFKGKKDTSHYIRGSEFNWPKEPVYFDDLSPDANTLIQIAQHNGEESVIYHEVGKKLGWEPERIHKASHELQRKDIGNGVTVQEGDFYAKHGYPDAHDYDWKTPFGADDETFTMRTNSEYSLSFVDSKRIKDLVAEAPKTSKVVEAVKPAEAVVGKELNLPWGQYTQEALGKLSPDATKVAEFLRKNGTNRMDDAAVKAGTGLDDAALRKVQGELTGAGIGRSSKGSTILKSYESRLEYVQDTLKDLYATDTTKIRSSRALDALAERIDKLEVELKNTVGKGPCSL